MYVIDTSALLDGWVRYYPPDVFPALWSHLEDMIKSRDLLSPDEVLLELGQKDDEIHKWAKANSAMFVPLDEEIQNATQEILSQFPRLVGAMKRPQPGGPVCDRACESKGSCSCYWREEQWNPRTAPNSQCLRSIQDKSLYTATANSRQKLDVSLASRFSNPTGRALNRVFLRHF